MAGSRSGARPTGSIAAIPITMRPTVTLGPPVLLFGLDGSTDVAPSTRLSSATGFDVTRDGRRFVLARRTTAQARRRMAIVQNW